MHICSPVDGPPPVDMLSPIRGVAIIKSGRREEVRPSGNYGLCVRVVFGLLFLASRGSIRWMMGLIVIAVGMMTMRIYGDDDIGWQCLIASRLGVAPRQKALGNELGDRRSTPARSCSSPFRAVKSHNMQPSHG